MNIDPFGLFTSNFCGKLIYELHSLDSFLKPSFEILPVPMKVKVIAWSLALENLNIKDLLQRRPNFSLLANGVF